MKTWILALLLLCMSSLVACSASHSPMPDHTKEYLGLFTGAIVGGIAGGEIGQKGRTANIALGAVAGALIGFGLGKIADDLDREKVLDNASQPASKLKAENQQKTRYAWRGLDLHPQQSSKTAVASKKEKSTKGLQHPHPVSRLSQSVPSMQWFVNDTNQEELG